MIEGLGGSKLYLAYHAEENLEGWWFAMQMSSSISEILDMPMIKRGRGLSPSELGCIA